MVAAVEEEAVMEAVVATVEAVVAMADGADTVMTAAAMVDGMMEAMVEDEVAVAMVVEEAVTTMVEDEEVDTIATMDMATADMEEEAADTDGITRSRGFVTARPTSFCNNNRFASLKGLVGYCYFPCGQDGPSQRCIWCRCPCEIGLPKLCAVQGMSGSEAEIEAEFK